jgi:hypothetical protein
MRSTVEHLSGQKGSSVASVASVGLSFFWQPRVGKLCTAQATRSVLAISSVWPVWLSQASLDLYLIWWVVLKIAVATQLFPSDEIADAHWPLGYFLRTK